MTGVAREADRTVRAPFTGRECLAYSWYVDAVTTERGSDGVRFRRNVVDRGREVVPFLVDDGTGSVLVDPKGSELRLAEAWVEDYRPDPADRGDLVFDVGAFPGWEQYDPHYYEARLDEGETVSLHGRSGPTPRGYAPGESASASPGGGRSSRTSTTERWPGGRSVRPSSRSRSGRWCWPHWRPSGSPSSTSPGRS